jgi:hypothetical protein
MVERYGKEVLGICTICGAKGNTEMHHIISKDRCKKIGKPEWINKNPGNIIELCTPCHDETCASLIVKNDMLISAYGEDNWADEVSRWESAGYVPVSEVRKEVGFLQSDFDDEGNQKMEEIVVFSQLWNRINSQRAKLYYSQNESE